MEDARDNKPAARNQRRALTIASVIGCTAAIYLMYGLLRNDGTSEPAPPPGNRNGEQTAPGPVTRALSKGALAAFLVQKERPAVPEISFEDAGGKARSLAEWRGRVVLLNLWATWCGPCREEMPELARLQEDSGSPDFEVVALSLDRAGAEVAVPFLAKIDAGSLAVYLDPSGKALHEFSAIGLPATILIDRQGKEIGRLLGPARWASPEAITLIKTALGEPEQIG